MANKYWRDDFKIAPTGIKHKEPRGISGSPPKTQQKGFDASGKGASKGWDIPSHPWGIRNTATNDNRQGKSKGWDIPSR